MHLLTFPLSEGDGSVRPARGGDGAVAVAVGGIGVGESGDLGPWCSGSGPSSSFPHRIGDPFLSPFAINTRTPLVFGRALAAGFGDFSRKNAPVSRIKSLWQQMGGGR